MSPVLRFVKNLKVDKICHFVQLSSLLSYLEEVVDVVRVPEVESLGGVLGQVGVEDLARRHHRRREEVGQLGKVHAVPQGFLG